MQQRPQGFCPVPREGRPAPKPRPGSAGRLFQSLQKMPAPRRDVIPGAAHAPALRGLPPFGDGGVPVLRPLVVVGDPEHDPALSRLEAGAADLPLLLVPLVRQQLELIPDLLVGHRGGVFRLGLVVPPDFRELVVRQAVLVQGVLFYRQPV